MKKLLLLAALVVLPQSCWSFGGAISATQQITGNALTVSSITVTNIPSGAVVYSTAPSGANAGTLTGVTANLFYDAVNNRLGIGTAVPSTTLHLLGSSSSRAIFVNSPPSGLTNGVANNAVAEWAIFAEPYGASNTSMLDILAFSTGVYTPMFRISNHWENTASPITSSSGTIALGWYTGGAYNDFLYLSTTGYGGSNGSLGISTGTPARVLDVNGSSMYRGVFDVLTGSVTVQSQNVNITSATLSVGGNGSVQVNINGTGTTTDPFVVGTSTFIIKASGRVGIGLAGPLAPLDIEGGTSGSLNAPAVGIQNNRFVTWWDATNAAWAGGIYVDATNTNFIQASLNNLIWDTGSGNAERMRITTAGNIGINTTTPTRILDVNGAAEVRGVFDVISASTTFGGAVGFQQKTKAQFDTLVPAVGDMYVCTNCAVTYAICVATAAAADNFRREDSSTAGCGSGN